MKKLLSVVFLAAVLAACSNTPVPEDTGAPMESRAGSGTDVKTVSLYSHKFPQRLPAA